LLQVKNGAVIGGTAKIRIHSLPSFPDDGSEKKIELLTSEHLTGTFQNMEVEFSSPQVFLSI
jgi:hypothetical protein